MRRPLGASGAARPAVVHLVWTPLGPQPLRDFLDSYRRRDAGARHDLVIALNGPDARALAGAASSWLLRELDGTEHGLLVAGEDAQDLVAYRRALAQLDHERVCVLNSYSRLLHDGWLAKLEQALAQPAVGIVAATGSWASPSSYALFHLGLPSPYRRVFGDRAATIAMFEALEHERTGALPGRGLRGRFDTTRALAGMAARTPPFPAAHLRTNAFMAARELLVELLPARLARKAGAYRVESGWRSLTRRVRRTGLRAQVVDCQGRGYDAESWPDSETFWQGSQRGLLIADNQTAAYQSGDEDRRRLLARFAWGARADPRAGGSASHPVEDGGD